MAQINLRVDDDVKLGAEKACADIGLSMSAAINVFLKKVAREKRIPFELSVDPFYSEKNKYALTESMEQLRMGKTVVKTMEELEDMTNE